MLTCEGFPPPMYKHHPSAFGRARSPPAVLRRCHSASSRRSKGAIATRASWSRSCLVYYVDIRRSFRYRFHEISSSTGEEKSSSFFVGLKDKFRTKLRGNPQNRFSFFA